MSDGNIIWRKFGYLTIIWIASGFPTRHAKTPTFISSSIIFNLIINIFKLILQHYRFDAIFNKIRFHDFVFRIRAKYEIYNLSFL